MSKAPLLGGGRSAGRPHMEFRSASACFIEVQEMRRFRNEEDDTDGSSDEHSDKSSRPLSPSILKDDVSLSMEIVESYTVPIPAKLASPPPKKVLDLGQRRTKPTVITAATMITAGQGTLIGMDTGYVGMWFLPGSNHINPYMLMGYHRGSVTAAADLSFLAFGAKSRSLIATGGADSTIRIWTYKNESARNITDADYLIQTIAGHKGTITGVACVGNVIVSCSKDGSVRTWKPREGREVAFYPWFEPYQTVVETFDRWFMCLGFDRSPYLASSQQLIVGTGQGGVHALEVEFSKDHRRVDDIRAHASRALQNLRASDFSVSAVKHIPTRGMIAVTSFDNFLRVYDDRSGALLHSCENAEGGHFVSMCIDEINDQIILLDRGGVLTIYDLERSRIVATKVAVDEGEGVAVLWRRAPRKFVPEDPTLWGALGMDSAGPHASPDPPSDFASGRDPFARSMTDLEGGASPSGSGLSPTGRLKALQKKNAKFAAFAIEEDLAAAEERTASFLSAIHSPSRSGRNRQDQKGPTKDELLVVSTVGVTAWLVVRGLEYSIAPGGHDVPLAAVAASAEALVPLQLAELEIPQRVMFNNTDELERIFSCSLDGCVKVWDAYDLCCLRTLNLANKGEISCFTYLPLNMMLAVGHENGGLSLIHPESGTATFIAGGHRPNTLVHALCYLPQRALDSWGPGYVASAGSDGSVGLWELVPKAPYHPHFVGQFDNGRPESEASALAHDGLLNVLCTGFTDGSVELHLAATREHLGRLRRPGSAGVRSLLMHGGRLYIGRDDGSMETIDVYGDREAELRQSFALQRNFGIDLLASIRSELQTKGPASFPSSVFEAHEGPITDLKPILKSGKVVALASSSLDGRISLWRLNSPSLIKSWKQPEEIRSFCVRAKAFEILAGTASGRIVKFSYRDLKFAVPGSSTRLHTARQSHA